MSETIPMSQDQNFMDLALDLARQGKGFTSPNPCVGAVVVKNGRVLGKGFHRAAGMPHAEVEALNDVANSGGSVRGATLYVTLEPCNHFGKTPPCTHKILESEIARVVIGCHDPNPHVAGKGMAFLQENGVSVTTGIRQEEACEIIEDFSWYMLNGRSPFVVLKCAATLDGYIATSTGNSQWITGEKARGYGHLLRHEADAILIGSGTLHADNPSLTARIPGKETKNPMRVVLDTHLTIDETSRLIGEIKEAPVVVICEPLGDVKKQQKKEALVKKGVQILEVDTIQGRLDLNQVVEKLGKMGVMNLLIEGGGTIAASFLGTGLVNKVCYFVAPKLLGANDGIPVFRAKGPENIAEIQHLEHVTMKQLGNDVLFQGYPVRSV